MIFNVRRVKTLMILKTWSMKVQIVQVTLFQRVLSKSIITRRNLFQIR